MAVKEDRMSFRLVRLYSNRASASVCSTNCVETSLLGLGLVQPGWRD